MSERVEDRSFETTFTEMDTGNATIGLLSDVSNEQAWIQSDETVTVEP